MNTLLIIISPALIFACGYGVRALQEKAKYHKMMSLAHQLEKELNIAKIHEL